MEELDLKYLNPHDMGWKCADGCLNPIKTELNTAPDFILYVVRCKSKMTFWNTRELMACSCKKNGIKCELNF